MLTGPYKKHPFRLVTNPLNDTKFKEYLKHRIFFIFLDHVYFRTSLSELIAVFKKDADNLSYSIYDPSFISLFTLDPFTVTPIVFNYRTLVYELYYKEHGAFGLHTNNTVKAAILSFVIIFLNYTTSNPDADRLRCYYELEQFKINHYRPGLYDGESSDL